MASTTWLRASGQERPALGAAPPSNGTSSRRSARGRRARRSSGSRSAGCGSRRGAGGAGRRSGSGRSRRRFAHLGAPSPSTIAFAPAGGAMLGHMAERPKPRWWDGPPRPEPEAGHVPLPAVRAPPSGAQRAHADVPRGRPRPPAPRPQQVRVGRPRGRQAADPGGVAEDPAAPAERVAAAHGPSAPPRTCLASPCGAGENLQNAPEPSRAVRCWRHKQGQPA